ncbi:MAG TPA: hypothetical protein ENN80_12655, partial [Candidatus Hydrogenedentes bacterium]|nr:hypothetical protein [Candidatus Hydrogenedentota bacterium]
GEEYEALLSIPLGEATPGEALNVEIVLEHENLGARFTTPLAVVPARQQGTVYVVTGNRYHTGAAEDQAAEMERAIAQVRRNCLVAEQDERYGFDLGDAYTWRTALVAQPELRDDVRRLVGMLRCGGHPGYGTPDERIVCGEVLVRNLAYGVQAQDELLGDPGGCYFAWNVPGICPQTPEILAEAGLMGLVGNVPVRGKPSLFRHQAPSGARVLHRHKRGMEGPGSLAALREAVSEQSREVMTEGLGSDILVVESATVPPEPFYLGACGSLRQASPSIVVSGTGGHEFMREALDRAGAEGGVTLATTARVMHTHRLGELVSQPEVKIAYGAVEHLVLDAERWATFAALLGAQYPESALDLCWRQLLFTGRPDCLGFAATPEVYVDTLAALHEAATVARHVGDEAAAYIAGQADTASGAPPRLDPHDAEALVVFNPSSWMRTDVCEARVAFPRGAAGITVFDDGGRPVAFGPLMVEKLNTRMVFACIRFVARDVPALGYRTYYVQRSGKTAQMEPRAGAQIENEYFLVLADPLTGALAKLVDKDSGVECGVGPLNDVLALDEDAARTAGGRDLWTTGAMTRPDGGPAKVTVVQTEWMQELESTIPFLGGEVVRTLTLYAGVRRVDCSVRLEGVDVEDR